MVVLTLVSPSAFLPFIPCFKSALAGWLCWLQEKCTQPRSARLSPRSSSSQGQAQANADRGTGVGGLEPFSLISTTRTQTDVGWPVPGSDRATPVLGSLALVDKRGCWKSYQKIMPNELPLAARTGVIHQPQPRVQTQNLSVCTWIITTDWALSPLLQFPWSCWIRNLMFAVYKDQNRPLPGRWITNISWSEILLGWYPTSSLLSCTEVLSNVLTPELPDMEGAQVTGWRLHSIWKSILGKSKCWLMP